MDALLPYVPTIGYSGLALLVMTWLDRLVQQARVRAAPCSSGSAPPGCTWRCSRCSCTCWLCSLANDSLAGPIGFGFLVAMFAMGLVLSVVQVFASLRGPSKLVSSATN